VSSVFVIGNGESRANFNLASLKNQFTLIGCNAIHRDLTVDHLVCCDRRMVEEATNNPLTANTTIHVREDWFKYYRKIPYTGELKQDKAEHWGSGGYAVLVAASLGFTNINLIGFDLYSKNNKVNNIYKGTDNYSKPESQSVDHSFWVYQISKIFKHYPDVQFTIYNQAGWEMPDKWQRNNVRFENIGQLIY